MQFIDLLKIIDSYCFYELIDSFNLLQFINYYVIYYFITYHSVVLNNKVLLDGKFCQIEIPKAKSNPFHNTSPGPSMAEMAQNRQTQQLGLQQVHFCVTHHKTFSDDFRRLENSIIKIGKSASIPLIFNHLKWTTSYYLNANSTLTRAHPNPDSNLKQSFKFFSQWRHHLLVVQTQ